MKILCLLFTTLPLLCLALEPSLKDLLQQGLMAEEAESDLNKAAKAYESLVEAGDAQEKLVATGLYRLAEIRRRQGRKEAAAKLYQKLIFQFPAQEALIKMAQENLVMIGAAPVPAAMTGSADTAEAQEIARLERLLSESPDRVRDEHPLHMAAQKGWKRLLEAMIARGFDVNQPGPVNSGESLLTPLAIAAREGNKALAELLIEKGADVNGGYDKAVEIQDPNITLPLVLALSHDRKEVLEVLLDHGASLSVRTPVLFGPEEGTVLGSPLHLLAISQCMASWNEVHGAKGPHPDVLPMVRLLLAHHADLAAVTSTQSEGPASRSHLFLGVTPLGLAAKYGETEVVKILLDAGAAVNATDAMGRTALFDAMLCGGKSYLDVPRLLIEHGATLTARDKQGRTPLAFLISMEGQDWSVWPELQEMTLPKARLLVAKGADPKVIDNDGNTLLHLCALAEGAGSQQVRASWHKRSEETEQWLMSLGIDPALKNKNGETPLDLALRASLAAHQASHLTLLLVALTTTKDRGVWDCRLPPRPLLAPLYAPLSEAEPLPSLAEFALLHMAHAAHEAGTSGMPGVQPRGRPSRSDREGVSVMVQVLHHPAPGIPAEKLVETFDLLKDDLALYKPLKPGDAIFMMDYATEWTGAAADALLVRLDPAITVSYSGVERHFHLDGVDVFNITRPALDFGLWREMLGELAECTAPVDLMKVRLVRQVNGKPVEREMNLVSGIAEAWPRVMNGDRIELAGKGPLQSNGVIIALADLGLAFVASDDNAVQWPAPVSSALHYLLRLNPPGRDWSRVQIWHKDQKEPLLFDLAQAADALQPDSDPHAVSKAEPQMNPGDRLEVPVLPGHESEFPGEALKSYVQRVTRRALDIRPGGVPGSFHSGGRRRVLNPPPPP